MQRLKILNLFLFSVLTLFSLLNITDSVAIEQNIQGDIIDASGTRTLVSYVKVGAISYLSSEEDFRTVFQSETRSVPGHFLGYF